MKKIVRTAVALLALVLTGVGGLGLALTYAPDHGAVQAARDGAEKGVNALAGVLPVDLPEEPAEGLLAAISGFPLRFVLGPLGLVILIAMLLPGGRGELTIQDDRDPDEDLGLAQVDRRSAKKAHKQAIGIAKKGMPLEAGRALLCGGPDGRGGRPVFHRMRTSTCGRPRSDTTRTASIESAELYAEGGGNNDAAGVIYGQLERLGEALRRRVRPAAGNLSVAAEMYEKAGNHRRAAQCFREVRVPSPRCPGLGALRGVGEGCEVPRAGDAGGGVRSVRRERPGARRSSTRSSIRMTGNLYERAGEPRHAPRPCFEPRGSSVSTWRPTMAAEARRTAEARSGAVRTRQGARRAARRGNAPGASVQERRRRRASSPSTTATTVHRAGGCSPVRGGGRAARGGGSLPRCSSGTIARANATSASGTAAQAAEMFVLAGDRAPRVAATTSKRQPLRRGCRVLPRSPATTEREAELLEKGGRLPACGSDPPGGRAEGHRDGSPAAGGLRSPPELRRRPLQMHRRDVPRATRNTPVAIAKLQRGGNSGARSTATPFVPSSAWRPVQEASGDVSCQRQRSLREDPRLRRTST